MQQSMKVLWGTVVAIVILAIPALALSMVVPSTTADNNTVLASEDDPLSNGLKVFKPQAKTEATQVAEGNTSDEVTLRVWVETGRRRKPSTSSGGGGD